MIIRRSAERGLSEIGWLRSFHTFSFANYHDPKHMGFRTLRVINEDRVQPSQGFGTHPHRNMEILTYILEGELQHRDSMGTGSIIRPGEVQRMSAGTGVTHSESNPSNENVVHFLQIWILPAEQDLKPSYEQKAFPRPERWGKLRLVASADGRDGSLTVHQDVALYAGTFGAGKKARHDVARGRHAWVQVARGNLELNGTLLDAGDAAAVSEPGPLEITGKDAAEVLVFDLS